MERRLGKGTEEFQFFTDYWQFRQKYYEADNDEDWFLEMMNAGESLMLKYSETDFAKYARQLVFSHFEFVEDKWKGKRHE